MARAPLAPTRLGAAGVALQAVDTAAELTDGNSYAWREGRHLYVANGDDSTLTLTIPTPGTVGAQQLAIADAVFTVNAGEARVLPSLGPEFRQDDGSVHVNYAGADAAVTVAVLDLA